MSNKENDAKWNVLQVKLQGLNASEAFKSLREGGFEPILIKGYAVAKLYPPDVGRSSVDIDLCFDPEDYEKAQEYNRANPVKGVNVDFHNGFRHLDAMGWDQLYSRSVLIDADGTKVRTLCEEDHLRVLCVHWLTDGGENKGRLWDIYYGVSNRSETFDWDKCLDVVSERRQNWVIYTVGLANKYLGLDISGLPFEEKARQVPKWLSREVKRHWDLDIPIVPLNASFHDREKLWEQIKKRIPPNPIHATIAMEGSLDSRSRVFYQIGNFFQRLVPTWRNLGQNAFRQLRRSK